MTIIGHCHKSLDVAVLDPSSRTSLSLLVFVKVYGRYTQKYSAELVIEEKKVMKVVLARIDERLMHGIVLTQYLPGSGAKRIMVVDDDVANSPIRKDAMMMAKPAGYAASIITLEKALTNIKAHKYDGQKVFLLARKIEIMRALQEVGVEIPELIIGCTDLMNEGIRLSSRAFITEQELEICKQMKESGTSLVVQHAITQPKEDLWKIVNG